MRAVIIGASGGIGQALTRALAQQAGAYVFAFSRSGRGAFPSAVTTGQLDALDEEALAAAAKQVSADGPPDLVIVATGILSDGDALQPEKSYRQQSQASFERVFAANTIAPALVAKHFLPVMPREGRSVFAVLSARVGSISDNKTGGWHAYRASKAALNMLIRNYALEQVRRAPDCICVGLHPGTVDTALSAPFQRRLPMGQLFTPEQSATALLSVVDGLNRADSGHVFDWKGDGVDP